MPCVFIGDSIAVGAGSVQHECEVHAKVGASSEFIVKNFVKFAKNSDEYTVISMGSNGPTNPTNKQNALKLRRSIKASLVVWILPYNRQAANTIREVANAFNDSYVDLSGFQSNDGLHPRSYKKLNNQIQERIDYYFD